MEPCLARVWGWSISLVGVDLLHVLHLGVLRDLCGSALKVLIKDKHYYNGNTIAKRFRTLTRELKSFVKANRLQLYLRNVKKSTIAWKSDACPELRCKAADCGVILKYLTWKTQHQEPPSYKGMTACLWSAETFTSTLMAAGMVLTEEEKQTAHTTGEFFVQSLLCLANLAITNSQLLWKARPKLHYLVHVYTDVLIKNRNPAKDATWMDEDLMRATFHMRRKMSSKTSPLNVLRRYAVVSKGCMDKYREKRAR